MKVPQTKPIEDFIPRVIEDVNLKEVSNFLVVVLEELVNYGSNIFKWEMDENIGFTHIPYLTLLRGYIENIDATSVLIKSGSIDPCNALLRTNLEIFLNLIFLLEDNSGERAKHFIVYDHIQRLNLIERHNGVSQSYLELEQKYLEDKLLTSSKPYIFNEWEQRSRAIIADLEAPFFKNIYEKYQSLPNNRKKYWFSIFDKKLVTVKSLAYHLGYPAIYEVLFKGWSKYVHGTNIIEGKISFDDENIFLAQIRIINNNLKEIATHNINLSLVLFDKYLLSRFAKEKTLNEADWFESMKILNIEIQKNIRIENNPLPQDGK